MKLSSAFDGLARENHFLKLMVKITLTITVGLLGILYNLYDRVPLMVERSSRGLEIARATEFRRTDDDLKQAIGTMMRARFDSTAISPELFLNSRQLVLRDTEQKEMKARGMNQSVIVRAVSIGKDQAVVDVDRVISVGEIRSALKAKLTVSFEEISPNELNPFGLLLSVADPIEEKGKK